MEKQNEENPWIGQYVLDEQGNPRPEHDLLTWARWYQTAQRQIVLTRFRWGRVSTIFMGLDQDYFSIFGLPPDPLTYKPLVWETMVFGGKMDREQRRYRSREEALAGHAWTVKECKAAQEHFWDRICLKEESWIWQKLCKRLWQWARIQ